MACCCKPGQSNKSAASCLGRCDLPKHRCLDKEEVKPGPVPKYMGWHYTARNAPEHQLRCGWRPGHISCEVLKKIEQHNSMKSSDCCSPCPHPSPCLRPLPCPPRPSCYKPCYKPCVKPCCSPPPRCLAVCPSIPSTCCKPPPSPQPLIRIVRHGGQYTISTKPSDISNAPSGPYPLKYVLDTDGTEAETGKAKFSLEAKFNDYHFDYISSQDSFVLDFSPPDQKCYKPYPKKSIVCMFCQP